VKRHRHRHRHRHRYHDEEVGGGGGGGVPFADALATLFSRTTTTSPSALWGLGLRLRATACSAAMETLQKYRFSTFVHNNHNTGTCPVPFWRHSAFCCVPVAAAWAIQTHPQIVAAAVTAFYNRDPTEVSAAQSLSAFRKDHDPDSPEKAGSLAGLVVIQTHFTRCLYAQLSQQRFSPPGIYLKALSRQVQYEVVAALSQLEEEENDANKGGGVGGGDGGDA
jgi:hypothetical protein